MFRLSPDLRELSTWLPSEHEPAVQDDSSGCMLSCSVWPYSPLQFIPHRFDFQRSDPSDLLYSLHKPFYIAVCFCPSGCHLTVLKPLLLGVFFKFMAVERWSVIWFDFFLHPICVEHPPDYRYCCFHALGLLAYWHTESRIWGRCHHSPLVHKSPRWVLRAQRSGPLSRQSLLLWLVHGKLAYIVVPLHHLCLSSLGWYISLALVVLDLRQWRPLLGFWWQLWACCTLQHSLHNAVPP